MRTIQTAVIIIILSAIVAIAQTPVTLNGVSYTLRAHPRVWLDGPGGALTTSLSDSENRAQTSNPAYSVLLLNVSYWLTQDRCSTGANTYSGMNCQGAQITSSSGSAVTMAAYLWLAQGSDPADPNGYLAFAIQGMNHIDDFWDNSAACDETLNYCGRNNTNNFTSLNLSEQLWQAYSIVHDKMTPVQRTNLANKVLNDNDTSHNGISSVACIKQTFHAGSGSLSTSTGSNVVTGSGTSFTSLAAGQVLFNGGTSSVGIGVIYSITSNTQLILTTRARSNESGNTIWTYADAQGTGSNCGMVWLEKHAAFYPPVVPGQEANIALDYPPNAGTYASPGINLPGIAMKTSMFVGLALADDDARAVTLLQYNYNCFYTTLYPLLKYGWDGFAQGASDYTPGIWWVGVAGEIIALRNSIVSGPDLTGGKWVSRMVNLANYAYVSAQPDDRWMSWGDTYTEPYDAWAVRGPLMACYIQAGPTGNNSSDCQSLYNYIRNVRSDYSQAGWNSGSGAIIPWYYLFYNYNGTAAPITNKQYTFKDSDITYAQCLSQFGSTPCVQNQVWGGTISRSDWTSTATQMFVSHGWMQAGQDHTDGPEQGAFHILRTDYLLGGDSVAANGSYNYCPSGGGGNENMIDLNCSTITTGAYTPMSRWAGVNPTGPTSNDYSYGMVDLTGLYTGSGHATRVNRHIAHLKKSSTQDYVIIYDDIAISAALPTSPRAYFNYYLNGIAPATAITYNGASRTVSNIHASSKLNSSFLPVAGISTAALVVDSANGTYPGGNGYTFRAYACPSSDGATCDATKTSGEWIGVFQPLSTTSGVMPALTQPACSGTGGNCSVVQVSDSISPKVAAFARQGVFLSGLRVTTTHIGTAQYLLAGLTAGNYAVTVGGTTVTGSPFTVSAGDNTLEFESTAGALVVSTGLASGLTKVSGTAIYGGNPIIH